MTTNFLAFLDLTVSNQKKSIQKYEIDGEIVWLKKASKRHPTWIYLPLQWITALLGLEVLAPIPNLGGTKAIGCEIQRLKQLQQKGICVPKILAYRKDAFLILDAAQQPKKSQQLDSALKNATSSTIRMKLYEKVIFAIENIHIKNSYLSEAFARNILIDTHNHFTFIDFETDPATTLTLKQCQSRDWLYLIFSTAYYFTDDELDQACSLLFDVLTKNIDYVVNISRIAMKLSWITKLKPEKFGKDGIRLKKSIELLTKLCEQLEDKKISHIYRN